MNRAGKYGEDIATEYLKSRGYLIVERNWRGTDDLRCPEIDIIAQKNSIIVFAEVKTSSTGKFGPPETWITLAKRRRLVKGAEAYLSKKCSDSVECRFDAITINSQFKPPVVNHIENAFLVSDIDTE